MVDRCGLGERRPVWRENGTSASGAVNHHGAGQIAERDYSLTSSACAG